MFPLSCSTSEGWLFSLLSALPFWYYFKSIELYRLLLYVFSSVWILLPLWLWASMSSWVTNIKRVLFLDILDTCVICLLTILLYFDPEFCSLLVRRGGLMYPPVVTFFSLADILFRKLNLLAAFYFSLSLCYFHLYLISYFAFRRKTSYYYTSSGFFPFSAATLNLY